MNFDNIYLYSAWLHLLIYLIIIFFFIKNKIFSYSAPYKFIGLYFLIIFILDTLVILGDYIFEHEHSWGHIYVPLDFSLIMLYLINLPAVKNNRKLLYGVLVAYLSFQYYISVNQQGFKEYNSLGTIISSSIILFLCIYNLSYFFIYQSSHQPLKNNALFWITLAIFLITLLEPGFAIIQKSNYYSQSDIGFYSTVIGRNILKAIFMLGYVKGVTLLSLKS